MSNDVKIVVGAETGGANAGLDRVDKGAKKVADTVDKIGKAAAKSAKEIEKMEAAAKRLNKTLGENSGSHNGGIIGSSRVNHTSSQNTAHAERAETRQAKIVANAVAGAIGVRRPFDVRPGQSPAASGMSMAGNLGRGMLAFAGITSIMSMAGKAIDLARREATANDQLLRSTGDLTRNFTTLRQQVRDAGRGLGISNGDSAALALQYARTAGRDGAADGSLRTGMGMSRAYGLDPGEGVGFMASMRQFGGVGKDDQGGKRLALMIAEAIDRSGSTAKAAEILQAVSAFTQTAARFALSTPNVGGYAGALSTLVSKGIPGLDAGGAANLLGTADSAIRSGAMGEAGSNFDFGALTRLNPGIHPVIAKAIMEQGGFGSGASLKGTELDKFFGGNSFNSLSSKDNFSVIKDEITRQYSDKDLQLDAYKNRMGLHGYQQAAALWNMEPSKLGGLSSLVGKAGISMESLTASGIGNLSTINTADSGGLNTIAKRLLSRDDVSKGEKASITSAMSGNEEKLRETLAKIVGTREQEKNVSTDIRDSTKKIEDTLTDIGVHLLPGIAGIQNAVTLMAAHFEPESKIGRDYKTQEGLPDYQERKKALSDKINDPKWIDAQRALGRSDDDIAKEKERQLAAFSKANSRYEDYLSQQSVNGTDADLNLSDITRMSPADIRKREYLRAHADTFRSIGSKLGVDPTIIAAQSGEETGWGSSTHGDSNNLSGIKADSNWRGDRAGAYRKYRSEEDWADDYVKFIQAHDGGAVGAGSDVNKFTSGLRSGRYSENPDYAKNISDIHGGLVHDGLSISPGSTQKISVNGSVTIKYPNGEVAGNVDASNLSMGIPSPAGAGG